MRLCLSQVVIFWTPTAPLNHNLIYPKKIQFELKFVFAYFNFAELVAWALSFSLSTFPDIAGCYLLKSILFYYESSDFHALF